MLLNDVNLPDYNLDPPEEEPEYDYDYDYDYEPDEEEPDWQKATDNYEAQFEQRY